MISDDVIQRLVRKYQTTELNIRREYYQHLFLSALYQQPESKHLYFKGGTALRILYHSPRFSEDLDFSTSLKNVSALENTIVNALENIEHQGMKTFIDEAKLTSGGYLAIMHFQGGIKSLTIQLEISFRPRKTYGEFMTIVNDFITPYSIMSLKEEDLVQEKMQALLRREKPRDFYDIYFLLRANLISPTLKNLLKKTYTGLKQSDINFERELKVFLPRNQWPIIRNFQKSLEREIRRFLPNL